VVLLWAGGPCLAYVAPLLLLYIGATRERWQDGLKVGLLFSLGRLLALVILGGAATVVFSFINRFFPPEKSGWLYVVAAFFMVSMGILVILGKGLKRRIGKGILDKGSKSIFLFGFLMGIAPCVPYVAVLTYIACSAENAILLGMLYAALFAIGTAVAPVVLGSVMGIISEKLVRLEKARRVFQVACGVVLIFFGCQLIYYIWNLMV